MIPPADHPRWREILDGSVDHVFKSVAAGLMVARLKRQLTTDGSAANRENSIRELRAFFEKFERVTADDISAIFS